MVARDQPSSAFKGSTKRPGTAVNAAAHMMVTKLTRATHQAGWMRGGVLPGAGGWDMLSASGAGVLICVTAPACWSGLGSDSGRMVSVR
ncbi:hypothetical protein GCM10023198_21120 [Promicromonospora umidemergens]|uniref:Uncharacterized protein n=1 Tax=Promicromonospora umidemergens TaxID=629679 RepID=A0ABP8X5J6_9MICO